MKNFTVGEHIINTSNIMPFSLFSLNFVLYLIDLTQS